MFVICSLVGLMNRAACSASIVPSDWRMTCEAYWLKSVKAGTVDIAAPASYYIG